MKRDNLYRFSLQFGADTASRIRAGECLERLGNKKSAVVVSALNEYLDRHPEFENETVHVQIEATEAMRKEQLEKMIRNIVQEQISRAGGSIAGQPAEETDDLDADIEKMLGNLEMFQ